MGMSGCRNGFMLCNLLSCSRPLARSLTIRALYSIAVRRELRVVVCMAIICIHGLRMPVYMQYSQVSLKIICTYVAKKTIERSMLQRTNSALTLKSLQPHTIQFT
jgi:hypothetical protein